MISVLFELDEGTLSQEEENNVSQASIQYSILNIKDGKYLVEAVLQGAELIEQFSAMFQYRNPFIIGIWDEEGTPTLLEEAVYLAWMPDIVTYDESGNERSRTRPTVPAQMHGWMGWSDKKFTLIAEEA